MFNVNAFCRARWMLAIRSRRAGRVLCHNAVTRLGVIITLSSSMARGRTRPGRSAPRAPLAGGSLAVSASARD